MNKTNFDILQMIIDNGITIREIPKFKEEFWRAHKKETPMKGYELIDHDGYKVWYRKTEVIDGGKWMAKKDRSTDSMIRWNKEDDGCFDTLEGAVLNAINNS